MAEIAITRRSEPAARRCPWCHEGASEGEDWVVCPRDHTPIHAACLEEYGSCPICREAVVRIEDRITVSPRLPPLAVERLTTPEMGQELRAFARSLRDFYAPTWLAPTLGLGALLGLANAAVLWQAGLFVALVTLAAYATLLGALRSSLARPRAARWLGRRPSEEARDLAARLVAGDVFALRRARSFQALRQTIAGINQTLDELEAQDRAARRRSVRRLRDLRRAELRRATPIDDARRIRGIGPGTVDTLRARGIANLEDLLHSRPLSIPGIGPHRAELLRSWSQNREMAIERLIAAEPEPEGSGLPGLASAAEAAVDQGRRELDRAADVLADLGRWQTERERLASLLAAMQAR